MCRFVDGTGEPEPEPPHERRRAQRALRRGAADGLQQETELALLVGQPVDRTSERDHGLLAAVGQLQRGAVLGRDARVLGGGGRELLGGRVVVTGLELGGTERAADLELLLRRLEQRPPQVAERDLRGATAPSTGGGLDQHAHRLLIAGGVGLVVMDGDALGVGAGRGEDRRRVRVGAGALAGGEVRVDGLAHERMDERKAPPGARGGRVRRGGRERRGRRQDRRRLERVRGAARCVGLQARERCRDRGLNAVAEDHDRSGERVRFGRQPAQAGQRGAADRAGGLALDQRGVGRGGGDVGQFAQELAEQERVAARDPRAGGNEGRLRVAADHPADGGLAEVVWLEDVEGRVGREDVEHRLARAGGHHQTRGEPVEALREVREPAQRRRVGPVEVVDEEQQRLFGGEVRGQPVQAVQGGRVALAVAAAQDRLGKRGRAHEVLVGHDRLEQLADDGEREVALELGGAGAEDPHAGAPARAAQEARLADPRWALDQQPRATPGAGRLDHATDRLQLRLAFFEARGTSWGCPCRHVH